MIKAALITLLLTSTVLSCTLDESVEEFLKKQIVNPHADYVDDPYERIDAKYKTEVDRALHDKSEVCALQYQDTAKKQYTLKTFPSVADAKAADYIVTHQGVCGACSTLQDLTVYLTTDLTRPVRKCGLNNPFSQDKLAACIQSLGFTDQCTQIWTYNTLYTKKMCFSICIVSYLKDEPFVGPDGQLNKCLQCDEDQSGPIFKYESGRTRRNSGIKSEIDRPADQVFEMTHCYY